MRKTFLLPPFSDLIHEELSSLDILVTYAKTLGLKRQIKSFLEENITKNFSVILTEFLTTHLEIIFPQSKKQNGLNIL